MAFVGRTTSRQFRASVFFALVFWAAAAPTCARAGYPDKSVRIVVPFAAGGVADITARIIAEKLGDKLGQRFYVENQAGAGGIVAARTVIASPADGTTLALLSNGTAVSVSLFKKLPYDPLKDFAPISSLGFFDFVFATAANSDFKTLPEFIAAAKAKPGALNVGTINVGSTQNLSAELFKTAAGLDFTIIPYRGTPEIQVALLQGDVALMIDSYSSMKGNLGLHPLAEKPHLIDLAEGAVDPADALALFVLGRALVDDVLTDPAVDGGHGLRLQRPLDVAEQDQPVVAGGVRHGADRSRRTGCPRRRARNRARRR